jgi:5-formyltetrahydrofolate cyclo-ligase
MTDQTDLKALARKAAFAARKAAHGTGLDQAANTNLLTALATHPEARIVAGYMAIRTEVDPLPAMTALVAEGRRVCVPVIQGAGQPLKFLEWHPGAEMVAGPFGAMVPAEAEALEPEVLIAPLVAFDRRGYRLGYGGGFYDRSLEGLRAKRPTRAIGFAYAAQELAEVPTEPTDQPLDGIVTEQGFVRF